MTCTGAGARSQEVNILSSVTFPDARCDRPGQSELEDESKRIFVVNEQWFCNTADYWCPPGLTFVVLHTTYAITDGKKIFMLLQYTSNSVETMHLRKQMTELTPVTWVLGSTFYHVIAPLNAALQTY